MPNQLPANTNKNHVKKPLLFATSGTEASAIGTFARDVPAQQPQPEDVFRVPKGNPTEPWLPKDEQSTAQLSGPVSVQHAADAPVTQSLEPQHTPAPAGEVQPKPLPPVVSDQLDRTANNPIQSQPPLAQSAEGATPVQSAASQPPREPLEEIFAEDHPNHSLMQPPVEASVPSQDQPEASLNPVPTAASEDVLQTSHPENLTSELAQPDTLTDEAASLPPLETPDPQSDLLQPQEPAGQEDASLMPPNQVESTNVASGQPAAIQKLVEPSSASRLSAVLPFSPLRRKINPQQADHWGGGAGSRKEQMKNAA